MLRNRFQISLISAMLVLVVLPVASTSAQSVPWREELQPVREETAIMVGDDVLTVELSVTISQQTLGLGYRNGLEEGTGMVFTVDPAAPQSFWMKGMRFCIDIVWIDGDEIIGAAESVCPDPDGTADADRPTYPSGDPVTHVLEVPAGWLAERGYGAGTPVEIPDDLLANDSSG
ncbi:hypothetical protein BH23CHL3_BH23CHL3_06140 [soil metagenome]